MNHGQTFYKDWLCWLLGTVVNLLYYCRFYWHNTFFRIYITFPVFIRIYLTGKIKLLSLSNSFVTNVVLQLSRKLFYSDSPGKESINTEELRMDKYLNNHFAQPQISSRTGQFIPVLLTWWSFILRISERKVLQMFRCTGLLIHIYIHITWRCSLLCYCLCPLSQTWTSPDSRLSPPRWVSSSSHWFVCWSQTVAD